MGRLGIMGGTFNPVHNGHIEVAKAAMEQFNLDKVLFVTSGNPPHKKGEKILNAKLRHKMVEFAIEGIEKVEACDYEVLKSEYSYTIETLKYLKKQYDSELFLIMGADSFHNLHMWYKPRAIMERCTLLVYDREGYDLEKDLKEIKKEYYCHVELIKSLKIDVSSSEIREKVQNGESVDGLLNEEVKGFIERNQLYKPDEGTFKNRIQKRLKPERFNHSVGVSKTASDLASYYNEDPNKAYIAGILHDCAKNLNYDEMMKKCADYDVEIDEHEMKNPALIHAKLGAKVAEYEFDITDEDILNAIKWHTLGRADMTTLEKIIFVADMIEPNRKIDGVANLRKIAYKDLDRAVWECTNWTIKFNKRIKREIHPNAFDVFSYYQKND